MDAFLNELSPQPKLSHSLDPGGYLGLVGMTGKVPGLCVLEQESDQGDKLMVTQAGADC